ncbi:MAG: SGNH/GDSL hydrolase family protein [Gammaproteobacteria bacterium]|nr:SGNH/GDSL hydrolase family protein [Gammaproteobacteria bacterium]
MKNILLVFFSILFSLCIGEAVSRYAIRWIPGDNIIGVPSVISERGYTLNPSSGEATQQDGTRVVKYHYFPPHLRGTPVDPNAKHILVLGDSFTFGWLLPWNHTFIYHLQNDVDKTFGKNKYQFLDAGTGGWGAADYLSYLEQYGAKTSPKFVIVFLNTDDIGRAIKRNIYKLKNNNSLELEDNFHPVPLEAIKKLIYDTWLFKHSVLLHLIRYVISSLVNINSRERDFVMEANGPRVPGSPDLKFENKFAVQYGEALFRRMNEWCLNHHAKLLVVTTGFNAFCPKNKHEATIVFLKVAPLFFAKEHITFYDTSVPFKKLVERKKFQIPENQHPNTFGAQAIAKSSWRWIKQKMVLTS